MTEITSSTFKYVDQNITPHLNCEVCMLPVYNGKYHSICNHFRCTGCDNPEHKCITPDALWYPLENSEFITFMLDNLEVYCPNTKCQQKIIRSKYTEHLEKCEFNTIVCTECQQKILKKDETKHQSECPQRMILCEYCGTYGPMSQIEKHITDPKLCPNICSLLKYLDHPLINKLIVKKIDNVINNTQDHEMDQVIENKIDDIIKNKFETMIVNKINTVSNKRKCDSEDSKITKKAKIMNVMKYLNHSIQLIVDSSGVYYASVDDLICILKRNNEEHILKRLKHGCKSTLVKGKNKENTITRYMNTAGIIEWTQTFTDSESAGFKSWITNELLPSMNQELSDDEVIAIDGLSNGMIIDKKDPENNSGDDSQNNNNSQNNSADVEDYGINRVTGEPVKTIATGVQYLLQDLYEKDKHFVIGMERAKLMEYVESNLKGNLLELWKHKKLTDSSRFMKDFYAGIALTKYKFKDGKCVFRVYI